MGLVSRQKYLVIKYVFEDFIHFFFESQVNFSKRWVFPASPNAVTTQQYIYIFTGVRASHPTVYVT
jgi:hypothetical protein